MKHVVYLTNNSTVPKFEIYHIGNISRHHITNYLLFSKHAVAWTLFTMLTVIFTFNVLLLSQSVLVL